MKKSISAFVAGAILASVPYLLLIRADAQGAGPARAQGGAGGAGGQGGFPGQPGQGGQGGFGGGQMGFQAVPPISSFVVDGEYIYAAAGNWMYKIYKNGMTVQQRIALAPQQRQERPPRPDGNGG